jgi:hypothetical protein
MANYCDKCAEDRLSTGSGFKSSGLDEKLHRSADRRRKVWSYLFNGDVRTEHSR